jgi:hypothetical protein
MVWPQSRSLAQGDAEVTLDVNEQVTLVAVLDALEARYPVLRATIHGGEPLHWPAASH